MTRKDFTTANAPKPQANVHPDLVAVDCDNLEGFNPEWVDETIVRNGHVLTVGTYLFPCGKIIKIIE